MSGIRLSDNHGVNPSVLYCPLCGQEQGVALLGRLKGEKKAPHKMLDTEPCKGCHDHMRRGIVLVEATPTHDGIHFHGGYWVLTEEAFQRIFTGEAAEQALKLRHTYVDPEVVERLGLRDIKAGD